MAQYERVAFIMSTTGHEPKQSQHLAEYMWLTQVTRPLRGAPTSINPRPPLDEEQIGLLMGLGLTGRFFGFGAV